MAQCLDGLHRLTTVVLQKLSEQRHTPLNGGKNTSHFKAGQQAAVRDVCGPTNCPATPKRRHQKFHQDDSHPAECVLHVINTFTFQHRV